MVDRANKEYLEWDGGELKRAFNEVAEELKGRFTPLDASVLLVVRQLIEGMDGDTETLN